MSLISEVKNLVLTAIRHLDDGSWNPTQGGEWKSPHIEAKVIIYAPTKYYPVTTYRVISDALGVWQGRLNGATARNIGKPKQLFTSKRIRELKSPLNIIMEQSFTANDCDS